MIGLPREYGADPDLQNNEGQSPRILAEPIAKDDVRGFFVG